MVPRNVTEAVKPPRPAPKEMRPLSLEETRRLFEAAKGQTRGPVRPRRHHRNEAGRAAGVEVARRDLKNATVSVSRTLTRSGGTLLSRGAKDEEEPPVHPPDAAGCRSLEAHLERQLREIGILGDRYEDQGLLFTTSTGARSTLPTCAKGASHTS